MTTYAIETRKLTKTYGRGDPAVRDLDLRVPEGTVFGYLGLNGAGKSTTIRMLTTLLRPTSGAARVGGHDVVEEPDAARAAIGLLGDEDGALARPHWTAPEYLGYFARLRGLPRATSAVHDALDLVGLETAARARAVRTYSTGMRRRVELARALLGEPRVLFLDEPTRGLDLPAKRETWDLVRKLVDTRGVTVFLSSHDTAEIRALCEEVAVIAKGRLVHNGRARDLGADDRSFEAVLVRLLQGRPATPAAGGVVATPRNAQAAPRGQEAKR